FSEPQQRALGLVELARDEYALHEGQAHNALHRLQLTIQTFNHNLKFKINNVRGQGPHTCAQNFLSTLSKDKASAADKYHPMQTAVLALSLSEEDKSLQPLLNTQLWCKNESMALAQGDTKTQDPWYWTVGRPSGLSLVEEKEWSIE
ncbi:hypothetical protein L208DRAFT_1149512, partial [Tricholoma matsutake]